ncbi:unnamed protein product [Blepharisma stoltei]|uniref:NPHP4 Ig-like domain-containing protein n=1 Tax=Blepharisma stoltei TaxID=1481888 RepID=A0AAU9INE0_9CILI|nr:unnamed protein product [Blepharisma stoltei]
MLQVNSEKIFIEHCIYCDKHKWCTNHDENKYKQYYNEAKYTLESEFPNFIVVENQIPVGLEKKFNADPLIYKMGTAHFPRIGSFEIYYRKFIVFSKLGTKKWPRIEQLAAKIREIQDYTSNPPKIQRPQTARPSTKPMLIKKRKVRSRPTTAKTRSKAPKPIDNENHLIEVVSTNALETWKSEDNRKEIMHQRSLPELEIASQRSIENEQPSIRKQEEVKTPFKVDIKSPDKTEVKRLAKIELKKEDSSPKIVPKENDLKSPKITPKENEPRSPKMITKEYEPKSPQGYEEKSPVKIVTIDELVKSASLRTNKELHPKREVTKSYDVSIEITETVNKKITYQNQTDCDSKFFIVSSHPDLMEVKDETLEIIKGQRGKIQLIFKPIYENTKNSYYLYIDKDGEPWECIQINAQYE